MESLTASTQTETTPLTLALELLDFMRDKSAGGNTRLAAAQNLQALLKADKPFVTEIAALIPQQSSHLMRYVLVDILATLGGQAATEALEQVASKDSNEWIRRTAWAQARLLTLDNPDAREKQATRLAQKIEKDLADGGYGEQTTRDILRLADLGKSVRPFTRMIAQLINRDPLAPAHKAALTQVLQDVRASHGIRGLLRRLGPARPQHTA